MEAATLQKKKQTLSKGKLKKTIRNVICRPDPGAWPVLLEEQEEALNISLKKLKVYIPEFKKLPWSELKNISKDCRPKPPPITKAKGLIFGINSCCEAVEKGECVAVILEALINPRIIAQSVIEACSKKDVPVVCLHNLRKVTRSNFGVKTSCLGVDKHCTELSNKIKVLSKTVAITVNTIEEQASEPDVKIDFNENCQKNNDKQNGKVEFQYLYRTNKKTRTFVPPSEGNPDQVTQNFSGQDFIEFPKENEQQHKRKDYMNMILKRISNNPNRKAEKRKVSISLNENST